MPRKAVAARPAIGVTGEKRLHAAGEIGLGRLENDVQVIGHDGKRVNTPGTPNGGSTEVFLEPIAVDVIAYDVLTAVAARHGVVISSISDLFRFPAAIDIVVPGVANRIFAADLVQLG